jgi:predicted nuclease of predicted toxin-antitoxin system
MRFLVDQNLSHRLCIHLAVAGHDAIHVSAVSLHEADDLEVLEYPARERRIIISSDTASAHSSRPADRASRPWC